MDEPTMEDLMQLHEAVKLFGLSLEQKRFAGSPEELLFIQERYLIEAMEVLVMKRGLSEGEGRFLEFLISIKRFKNAYEESNEFWDNVKGEEGPFIMLIDISTERQGLGFKVIPISKQRQLRYLPEQKTKGAKDATRMLESMPADSMLLRFADSEYSKSYGINFSLAFISRRPDIETNKVIEAIEGTLKAMLGFEDPLSMTTEERTDPFRSGHFFREEDKNILHAFERIDPSRLSLHQRNLFSFLFRVKRAHSEWMLDRYPESLFEEPVTIGLVRVDFSPMHDGNPPDIIAMTIEEVKAAIDAAENEVQATIFSGLLRTLESNPIPGIRMNYFDDVLSHQFGFPYDITMSLDPVD